jgi:archaellum component FlaC
MTDDEMNARFDSLMAVINNNQERLLERFHGVEKRLDTIDQTLASLLENQRTLNTMIGAVTTLMGDFAGRITKLEGG